MTTTKTIKAIRIGNKTSSHRLDNDVAGAVANLKEGKVMNTNNVRQRAVIKAIVSYINRGYVCPVTIIESVKIAHDASSVKATLKNLYRLFPQMRPEAK